MTLFDPTPVARHSDPDTAHEAAAAAKSGSSAMNAAILSCCFRLTPMSAFDVCYHVSVDFPHRWDEGSIRTAVSRLVRAGKLRKYDEDGKSPRGSRCARYVIA